MKKTLLVLGAAVLLGACATVAVEPTPIFVGHDFDAVAARNLLKPGINQIQGNAFLRQRGGGIVTCAGASVALVPSTAYTEARLGVLYPPGLEQTRMARADNIKFKFDPDPPEYSAFTRNATCDAQGNFVFDGVADGSFFVLTSVTWRVGYSQQGGAMLLQVSVKGGEIKRVIMSR